MAEKRNHPLCVPFGAGLSVVWGSRAGFAHAPV